MPIHVVVLTDGHASVGVTPPEVMEDLANQPRDRGITTSRIGIPYGDSPLQLPALAAHGGGRLYDAESLVHSVGLPSTFAAP